MTDCPLCGDNRSREVLEGSPYFRCCACGVVYNIAHVPLAYSDNYFIDDYRAQYGQTYEEDFPSIYRLSRNRISRIRDLWNSRHMVSAHSLLDVGSALGFFLKAAHDEGFTRLEGIEISQYAADYCRTRFGYSVVAEPFEFVILDRSYDVISAWFFIEHCVNTRAVLEKVYKHLNNGGVFAFSAPSIYGPLYGFNRTQWALTHPVDHKVDFNPRTVRTFLSEIGFSEIRVYAAGIHPERIMNKRNPLFPVFKRLYSAFSRHFSYSDTIEVYAIK
jgi:SAM-dependent methyltransferase